MSVTWSTPATWAGMASWSTPGGPGYAPQRALPMAVVEIAFSTVPDAPAPAWVDVTDYVRMSPGISISRGRQDEFTSPQPGRLSLTLDNSDGRFTYGNASSPYYPNVVPYRRIRVGVIVGGVTSWRFDGYVDGWPISWQTPAATVALIQIGATDRLSRLSSLRQLRHPVIEDLGAGSSASWYLDSPTLSVLDSTTILGDGPAVLYGLQESSGAVTAGDSTGLTGRPTLALATVGTGGGSVAFGTSGIMPEGTACLFTPASIGNGQVLSDSTLPCYLGGDFTFFAAFAWSGATGAQIAQTSTGSAIPGVALSVTPSAVSATLTPLAGSPLTVNSTHATADGAVHFVTVTVSGSTTSVYVDQNAATTGVTPASMGTSFGIQIGSTSDPVQVAWVGFVPRALSATEVSTLAGLATGAAERSDVWVTKWASWLGIDSDLTTEVGLSNVYYPAQDGKNVIDLVNTVNGVEFGLLVAKGDGTFAYQSRSHRYNRAASLTLDTTAGDIAPGIGVTVDMVRLVNSLVASRPAGATYRVADTGSIASFGEFSQSVTAYAASDSDLYDLATWTVFRYGSIEPRVPKLPVNLQAFTDGRRAQVLAVEVGDRVTLANLPAQAPSSTVDLFVEGVEERYSATEFLVTFNTSPGSAYSQVWTLDSASTSQLDTSATLAY